MSAQLPALNALRCDSSLSRLALSLISSALIFSDFSNISYPLPSPVSIQTVTASMSGILWTIGNMGLCCMSPANLSRYPYGRMIYPSSSYGTISRHWPGARLTVQSLTGTPVTTLSCVRLQCCPIHEFSTHMFEFSSVNFRFIHAF